MPSKVKPEDIIEFDVFGRKGSVGNIRYRTIIKVAVSQFYGAKSAEGKSIIAERVLEDLEPGRMLNVLALKDGLLCHYHIGDEASLRKVRHDFRNHIDISNMRKGNAGAPSLSRRFGKKKKPRVETKNRIRWSAPRGVTKSAKERPVSTKHTVAPKKIAIKEEVDARCIDFIAGEDVSSSGDPNSTSGEAELEATLRRLETENSTLLRERIEELTEKNQKLRKERYARMECDSDWDDDICRIGTGSIQPDF